MTPLVHWLWQGVALVTAVSLCLWPAHRLSASTRHAVWWATLGVVVALPFLNLLELPGLGAVLGIGGPAELWSDPFPHRPSEATSWIAWLPFVAFAAWVAWSGVRFRAALIHLDAAKRGCRPFPIVRERQLVLWKAWRNRGRRATLVTSEHVRAAGVLGLGYPRIAVAPTLVSSLTDDELDQLVLHEYAHVQRRDDVASAVQCFVKAVIGWHPAVWWIDRQLRIEREVACDDWVLSATSAPRTYARCLTRVAGFTAGTESLLMPAAAGQRQLTTRVVRLLDPRRNTSVRPSRLALAAVSLLLSVAALGLAGSQTSSIALPRVARATYVPVVDTPELTVSSLLNALSAPISPAANRIAQPKRSAADERGELANIAATDVVRAVALSLPISEPRAADVVAASVEPTTDSPDPITTGAAPVASAATAPSSPAVADAASATDSDTEADDAGSWVDSTRRALAGAGKSTGQSLAEAGVSAGQALADAGVATFKSSQKTAVKAGRFFSRLGRTLAKPF